MQLPLTESVESVSLEVFAFKFSLELDGYHRRQKTLQIELLLEFLLGLTSPFTKRKLKTTLA